MRGVISARKTAPAGAWLAFLAIAIQVLLPFVVAYEIALVGSPAYADSLSSICSAHAQPEVPAGSGQRHHGPSGGCPICTAMAAAQAFTAPAPLVLPPPRAIGNDVPIAAVGSRPGAIGAAPYQSRAPPPSV